MILKHFVKLKSEKDQRFESCTMLLVLVLFETMLICNFDRLHDGTTTLRLLLLVKRTVRSDSILLLHHLVNLNLQSFHLLLASGGGFCTGSHEKVLAF